MGIVDLVLLGFVALSTVVGLWRGFIKEVFALAVWFFALAAAFHFSGALAVRLEPWIEVPSARQALAFVGIFLVLLVAGGLLTWLVGKLVEKTGLSGSDRLLGAIFGAARGLLIVLGLMIAAGFTPVPADPWWSESRVIQSLMPLAEWASTFLPQVALDYLDFYPGSVDGALSDADTLGSET